LVPALVASPGLGLRGQAGDIGPKIKLTNKLIARIRAPDASGTHAGRPVQEAQLALAAQVRLELGEDAEHVEKALSGSRAGVRQVIPRFDNFYSRIQQRKRH